VALEKAATQAAEMALLQRREHGTDRGAGCTCWQQEREEGLLGSCAMGSKAAVLVAWTEGNGVLARA
jgi:hypothetical protein